MKNYRPNVGIVVFRDDGKVLLCERVENYPKRWQFPQGGIDDAEKPLEAAIRELREETSITSVKFVAKLPDVLRYDFPEDIKRKHPDRHYDGQEQYWYLFLFEGQESEINLNTAEPEFRSYQWIDIKRAVDLVVDFKCDVYQIVVHHFAQTIQDYLKNLS